LNNNTSYCAIAKSLIKKWHDKNLLPKSTDSSKVKTITNTNKIVSEKKFAIKRKSIDDDITHSNTLRFEIRAYSNWIYLLFNPFSESQSSDEYRSGESSSIKKRKVLSLAEYVGNKKPISSLSTTVDSTEKKLTDTQIKEIYAEFNANIEELAAKAPDLANNVNKKLTQKDLINSNRNGFIANDHNTKTTLIEKPKIKNDDLWEEEEDDSDDDDNDNTNYKQQIIKQSQPVKNNQIMNNNKSNSQQVQ